MKKKIVLIFMTILIILLFLFIIKFIKISIILNKQIENYDSIHNFYIKLESANIYNKSIRELYVTDKYSYIKQEKFSVLNDYENKIMYGIHEDDKTYDTKNMDISDQVKFKFAGDIYEFARTMTFTNKIKYTLTWKVSSTTYNNKKCYHLISDSFDIYIDKNTYATIYEKNKYGYSNDILEEEFNQLPDNFRDIINIEEEYQRIDE